MIKGFLVGLLLLLVLGTLGYGVYLVSQPKLATAKARFLVKTDTPSWNLEGVQKRSLTEREIRSFRETTADMVVSTGVLSAVLQNPTLQGTFLTKEPSPQAWLEENLVVGFDGESDLLEITLTGPAEVMSDLQAIVESVSQAYYDQVVMKDRFEGAKELESLKSTYAEYQMQLREKLAELASVRSKSGESAAGGADVRIRELEIESLERTFTLIADRIQQMELDLERPSQIQLVDRAYITEDD